MSDLGVDRLHRTDTQTRQNFSSIISFDRAKIVEARKFIEEIHVEFTRRFSTSTKDNTIYALTQNFFRLDKDLE